MLAASKWVKIESPDEPAASVARRALGGRLGLVWHYLAASAEGDGKDKGNLEDVHQLRVSTRRAMAAVRIFEPVTPGRRRRWFKKRLKQIRRAAGDARDLDVLRDRLTRLGPIGDGPAWTELMSELATNRQAAQQPIGEIFQRLRRKGFKRRAARLLAKLRLREVYADRQPLSIRCLAGRSLASAVGDFFAADPGAPDHLESLHQFRIAGKRLRYAMELFAGAFEPELRQELYPKVEELQDKLGQVNDLAAAQRRFQTWLEASRDPARRDLLHGLLESSRIALAESVRLFREYWTDDRAADLRSGFQERIGGVEASC